MTSSDNIVDTRDIIKRIEELESDRDAYIDDSIFTDRWVIEHEDYAKELAQLQAVIKEVGDEARHGVALIADSHFEDYARQFAEDVGAIDSDRSWPLNCIDWEAAAEALQDDFSSLEWDGNTFWYHS